MISIITPVYNSEKFLRTCIESVLKQSYKDFELILINDGSTDRSESICDEFAAKYSNIKVFHQKNKGVSSARNHGLEKVQGEWVTFLDSDDEIKEDYLKTLDEDSKDVDIVYQGLLKKQKDDKIMRLLDFNDEIITPKAFYKKFTVSSLGYIGGKLFKTKIIRNHSVRFDSGLSFSEDSLFILNYLEFVNSLKLSSAKNYLYQKDDPGIKKKKYDYEKELELLKKIDSQTDIILSKLKIPINSNFKQKEIQQYLDRVLERIFKIESSETRKIKLKNLLTEYQTGMNYKYQSSGFRGKLLNYAIRNKKIALLDWFYRKMVYR